MTDKVRFAAYVPTIEEVKNCHDRLMAAGGMLPIGEGTFEEDFYQCVIERAAEFIVIESVRYWKARVTPLTEGLQHGCDSESCLTSDDPLDEIPF